MLNNGRAAVDRAMELLREGLGPFVERHVARNEQAAKVDDFKRKSGLRKRIGEWDVSALLRFMDYKSSVLFGQVLDLGEQALLRELRDWRNKHSHQERLSLEDVDRALDSAARLLRTIKAESQAAEVALLRERLAEPKPPPSTTSNLRAPSDRQPDRGGQAHATRNGPAHGTSGKIGVETVEKMKTKGSMNKQSAMAMVNEHVGSQLLTVSNTNFANINSRKDVWWINVNPAKFVHELHIILAKDGDGGLIWLRIAAGSISAPEDVFRVKKDNGYFDFEISSRPERYLTDVKSGGTEYDFTPHVEYEWD